LETILDSDGSIYVPCAGEAAPCGIDNSCEVLKPCDDGNKFIMLLISFQMMSKMDGMECIMER